MDLDPFDHDLILPLRQSFVVVPTLQGLQSHELGTELITGDSTSPKFNISLVVLDESCHQLVSDPVFASIIARTASDTSKKDSLATQPPTRSVCTIKSTRSRRGYHTILQYGKSPIPSIVAIHFRANVWWRSTATGIWNRQCIVSYTRRG
jgi:hypothetical protein